ncbi:MAG: hypothetical protein GX548_02700 [Lentisphaerae bacterium]|nr:hypothetical protein [Lentisphaerota bacterium]
MIRPALLPLAALLLALTTSGVLAQQRIEFQRRSFDRSRFQRTGPTAPDPAPPAPPAPAAPAAPAADPDPSAPESPEFSFSSPASAPETPNAAAPAGEADGAAPAAPYHSASRDFAPKPADPLLENPQLDNIPTKWFNHPRDHDELLEIQKNTGACLLLYFKNPTVSNEKGLCNWFERRLATDIKWRRAMPFYLKLEITLPGNTPVRELAEKYRIHKTPALLVLKPGSAWPTRINLFRFNPRPELEDIETVIDALKKAATPGYQNLF